MDMRLLNAAAAGGLLSLTVFILYIGKALILPLVIAVIFWYMIVKFSHVLQHLSLGRFHLPKGVANLFAVAISIALIYGFFYLLTQSISNVINDAPSYQKKLQFILDEVNRLTGTKIKLGKYFSQLNFTSIFSTLASTLSSTASNLVLILIYLLFLFLEGNTFSNKIQRLCRSEQRYQKVNQMINQIDSDVYVYLKIKVGVNFIAGILSYICMIAFNVQYAEFWAAFLFLLHFIPFIGPVVAVVFILIAFSIQVTNLTIFIAFALILSLIQFLIGNIVEPKIMGSRLNLSPIVILLALAFWGALWGITGMFLCVPLMVVITIIFDKFPSTKPWAILMSAREKPIA